MSEGEATPKKLLRHDGDTVGTSPWRGSPSKAASITSAAASANASPHVKSGVTTLQQAVRHDRAFRDSGDRNEGSAAAGHYMIARDLIRLAAADPLMSPRPVRQALAEKADGVESRLLELRSVLPASVLSRAEKAASAAKQQRDGHRYGAAATTIQAYMRGTAARQVLAKQHRAAIRLQAVRRGQTARRECSESARVRMAFVDVEDGLGSPGESLPHQSGFASAVDEKGTKVELTLLPLEDDDLALSPPPPSPPPPLNKIITKYVDFHILLKQLEKDTVTLGNQGAFQSPATTRQALRSSQRKVLLSLLRPKLDAGLRELSRQRPSDPIAALGQWFVGEGPMLRERAEKFSCGRDGTLATYLANVNVAVQAAMTACVAADPAPLDLMGLFASELMRQAADVTTPELKKAARS